MGSAIRTLEERHAGRGDEHPGRGLGPEPTLRVAVVTCMDARIDLFAVLRLGIGEAHVIRNAGALVTDDVLRSLAISQTALGTREVMLLMHTRCGLLGRAEEELRADIAATAGAAPPFPVGAFEDLEGEARRGLLRLRECTFLPHRDDLHAFAYDVDSGRVYPIADP